jgi:hypothetical protein
MPSHQFAKRPANLLLRKALGNSACIRVLRQTVRQKGHLETQIRRLKHDVRVLDHALAEEIRKYDTLAELSFSEETLKANVRALQKEKHQLELEIRQLNKRL